MDVVDFRRLNRTHQIIVRDLVSGKSTAFSVKSGLGLAEIRMSLIELIKKV